MCPTDLLRNQIPRAPLDFLIDFCNIVSDDAQTDHNDTPDDQNQQDDLAVADKIKVYQISTDEKLNPMQATLQTTERDSLFDALDLANAWLRRAEKATQ